MGYIRTYNGCVHIDIICDDIYTYTVGHPMCVHAKLSALFMYCVAYLYQYSRVCAVLYCV